MDHRRGQIGICLVRIRWYNF